jgi:UDP-3-O-[3-hydroxymyristoyl] glucosamine N-acyltransferase
VAIGSGVKAGAQSGIPGDVPAGQNIFGTPALEAVESMRMFAALRKLPDLLRRVGRLEKELATRDTEKSMDQE